MTREELLKELEKLPKVETNNSISVMNSINVDDLMSAVDRLNKIPDYNDLLKENQELKKQLEDKEDYINKLQATKDKLDKRDYENTMQQKEFIKYLEDETSKWHTNYDSYNYEYEIEEPTAEELVNKILQKYKSIIGTTNE